jgi:hypothetical protein
MGLHLLTHPFLLMANTLLHLVLTGSTTVDENYKNFTHELTTLYKKTCQDLEKTTNLPQVTYKLYHIMLYTSPWVAFEPTTSVVIGTDCIGSCKSNYHTIMANFENCYYKLEMYDMYIFLEIIKFMYIIKILFFQPSWQLIYKSNYLRIPSWQVNFSPRPH